MSTIQNNALKTANRRLRPETQFKKKKIHFRFDTCFADLFSGYSQTLETLGWSFGVLPSVSYTMIRLFFFCFFVDCKQRATLPSALSTAMQVQMNM